MIVSEDEIATFVPKSPRILILGTMGGICARTIDGRRASEAFYYQDNRNHFWKVIQLVFAPEIQPKKMTLSEKLAFLDMRGIAMENLVSRFQSDLKAASNPSDTILFTAHEKGLLEFKEASAELKKVFHEVPIFFTCLSKIKISNLILGYFNFNELSPDLLKSMHFLPTPTRCNPLQRSIDWRKKMEFITLGI